VAGRASATGAQTIATVQGTELSAQAMAEPKVGVLYSCPALLPDSFANHRVFDQGRSAACQ